jgi:alpha-N-acetylglucosaminidase
MLHDFGGNMYLFGSLVNVTNVNKNFILNSKIFIF